MSVRDGRRPHFWYVTHDALAALHEAFPVGDGRDKAMAIVAALAALASKNRGRGGTDAFEATRDEIATFAGVSVSTLKRYVPRLIAAGLLAVESERQTTARVWLLLDAPSARRAEAEARGATVAIAGGSATLVATSGHGDPSGSGHGDPSDAPTSGHGDPNSHPGSGHGDPNSAARSGHREPNFGSPRPEHSGHGDPSPTYTRGEEATEEVEQQQRERTHADAHAICRRVAAHVLELDPGATIDPAAEQWVEAATSLLAARSVDDVLAVVDRLDGFWAPRILSPDELRRNFTRVVAQQNAANRTPRRRPHSVATTGDSGACVLEPGAPPMSVEDEWRRALPELRRAVGEATYHASIEALHPHADQDGQLVVAAHPGSARLDEERFGALVARIVGRPVRWVACEGGLA